MSPSQSHNALNGVAPRTGLGILLTENNLHSSTAAPAPPSASYVMSSMTSEQRLLIQEDLADRERQASSLAAAGMVAESVSFTRPVSSSHGGQSGNHQPLGLQAPPALGMAAPPANTDTTTEMDGINWNLLDLGNTTLDDLDMDFATLFDPANEAANVNMQTQGNGWAAPAPEAHPAPIQGLSNGRAKRGSEM